MATMKQQNPLENMSLNVFPSSEGNRLSRSAAAADWATKMYKNAAENVYVTHPLKTLWTACVRLVSTRPSVTHTKNAHRERKSRGRSFRLEIWVGRHHSTYAVCKTSASIGNSSANCMLFTAVRNAGKCEHSRNSLVLKRRMESETANSDKANFDQERVRVQARVQGGTQIFE